MSEIDETREDNWMAALCHFSVLLRFFGLIVPLIVYLTQKDRSPRLRFQALQALIYQGIGVVLGLVYIFFLLAGWFGAVFFGVMFSGITNNMGLSGMFYIPAVLIFLLNLFVGLIVVPAYYILALVGGWQTIKKGEFRYPLLGGWVHSWLKMDE